jgi:hypothetical protein
MNEIVREELKQVEAEVDAWHESVPVPNWGLQQAQWLLLSVTEDVLRLRLFNVKTGTMELGQYNTLLDHYKYILKYTLAHVAKLPRQNLQTRPQLDAEEWGGADALLKAHEAYDHAVAAFSGTLAGSLRCYREESGRYWFRYALSFERLANNTLESRTALPETIPLSLLLQFMFEDDDMLPPALASCVKRVRSSAARTDELRPRIDDNIIDSLDKLLGERRTIIPETWMSSIGTGAQISRAFRNLWLVAVSHLIAVTNASLSNSHRDQPSGLNVRWLLGEATPNWLIRVLTMRGGPSVEGAKQLIGLLTYGAQTKSPDPALQFLFPLRDGRLAIPWFVCATSNSERNLLVLLARIRKNEFDAASAAFEQGMVQDIRSALGPRNWAARFNTYVPGERAAGEVDVILLDREDLFAVVVELRWFLEPSEVGEVAQRERVGKDKAEQARKKSAAVARAILTIAQGEGLAGGSQWTVAPLAVFDGYLPSPTETAVPFVSHRAFLSAINRFDRLRELGQWLQSGDWLPKVDLHYRVEPTEMNIGSVKLLVDGVNPTEEGEQFVFERDQKLLRDWTGA